MALLETESRFQVEIDGDGMISRGEISKNHNEWAVRLYLDVTVGLDNGITHANLRDEETGQVYASVNLANGDESFVLDMNSDPAEEPSIDVVIAGEESGVVSEDTVRIMDTAEDAGPTEMDYGWDSWGQAVLWIGGISVGLIVLFFIVVLIFA